MREALAINKAGSRILIKIVGYFLLKMMAYLTIKLEEGQTLPVETELQTQLHEIMDLRASRKC